MGTALSGKVDVRRDFDVQGKLTSLRALAKAGPQKDLYSEYLGYEAQPLSGMPDDLPSADSRRFDGKISSIVRKFSRAAPQSVEWSQYLYDPTSYLKTVREFLPSSTGHFNTDGSLNPAALDFPSTPAQTQSYAYDGDFRLTSRVQHLTTHTYSYDAANHQLERRSTANLSPARSTSATENFTYDLDGNLIGDQGRGQATFYTSTEMPERIEVGGEEHHFLYDEDNFRIALLVEGAGGAVERKKVYVLGGEQEILSESEETATGLVTKHHLFGLEGVVGFDLEGMDTRILAVRNYLGSVAQNLDAASLSFQDEKGYAPYGALKKRVIPSSTTGILNEAYSGRGIR